MTKETKMSKNNIHPLADRVLVRREEITEKSAAGIIIPDTASKEKSKIGVVVAVGPGRVSDEGEMIPTSVKVGAKVIFNSGWDNEVEMGDDEDYFLVKESDILAVIK
jgi:chaperonin GroES